MAAIVYRSAEPGQINPVSLRSPVKDHLRLNAVVLVRFHCLVCHVSFPYVCVFVVGGLTVSDVRMTVKSIAAMRREREQPENSQRTSVDGVSYGVACPKSPKAAVRA